jgi:splicing factor 3A subunit 1
MDIEDEDEDDGDKIKVVSNYQPRLASNLANPANNATTIDPISGKAIPLNQLEEHMRISLLDPKWKEEQKRFLDKQKETGYAEGTSIAESLKLFAKKRGDIFGQSTTTSVTNSLATGGLSAKDIADEEAMERVKYAEASNVTWDGFYGSMAVTQQMKADAPMTSYNMPMNPMPNIGPSPVPPPPPPGAPMMDMRPPPPPMPSSYPSMGAPHPPMPTMNYNPYGMTMGLAGMPGMAPPIPPISVPPVISSYANSNVDESKAKKPRLDSTGTLFDYSICMNSLRLTFISPNSFVTS